MHLGLPPQLHELPAIARVHSYSDADRYVAGDASAALSDSRALRGLFVDLLNEQVDTLSQDKARAAGFYLDATRLYAYVVAGTDRGTAKDLEVACRTMAEAADFAGVHQIHTSVVVVIDNVAKLAEEEEHELRDLIKMLELLASPRQPAEGRMVGLTLASLASVDLGRELHSWHGSKIVDSSGGVALGSFGAAFVRYPYQDLVDHLCGQVVVRLCQTFEEVVSPTPPQVYGLAKRTLGAEHLTIKELAGGLREFSNHFDLNDRLGEIGRRPREARSEALKRLDKDSSTVTFETNAVLSFLEEQTRRTVDRLRREMTAQMVEPSGVLVAAALARETADIAEQMGESGPERQAYDDALRERQNELESACSARLQTLDRKTADLAAVEEHYLLGHGLAHALSLLAALVGYVVVPWLLFQVARSSPFGENMSAGYWVYIFGVLLVALIVAPLANVFFRAHAERQLGSSLAGQSSLAAMAVVLPAVIGIVCLLMVAQGISKNDVRGMLWLPGLFIAVVVCTFQDIVRAVWERIVNTSRWCHRHILRPTVAVVRWCVWLAEWCLWLPVAIVIWPMNVVRRARGVKPITWKVPAQDKPAGESKKGAQSSRGTGADAKAPRERPDDRRARILREVDPVQRIVQTAALSLAVVPFFGLLVVGVVEFVEPLPSSVALTTVLGRFDVAVFSFFDLSMFSLLLLLALIVLPMDVGGSRLRIGAHRSDVDLEFGDALRDVEELINVRVERQAVKLTSQAFCRFVEQARILAQNAEETYRGFVDELQKERDGDQGAGREGAVAASEKALRRVVDDTGLRPAFSIIGDNDALALFYGRRLGGEYPASCDVKASELAFSVARSVFGSWGSSHAGQEAARRAVRIVREAVEEVLRPDLATEFFVADDKLVKDSLAAYRGPRWKYTVGLSDSEPRTADFIVAPCEEHVVTDWLPGARYVKETRCATEVVALRAVYGLPIRALPEWFFLAREAAQRSGLDLF
jgi:hypothetical protein